MSRDNLIYIQQDKGGHFRIWEQSASMDPRMPEVTQCLAVCSSRSGSLCKAHDLDRDRQTEYGVHELERES
jgi:hypothetical protein